MSKKYGVENRGKSNDNIHIQEIKENGFTILRNQISKEEVNRLINATNKVYKDQIEEIGLEKLTQIQEADIVRAPFLYEDVFDQLIINKTVLEIVTEILGAKHILHLQNVIINRSKGEHHQSAWHRDIPYQNYTLSHPISLSAFYALSPFNKQTGGTKLIPKSHQFEDFPNDEFIQQHEFQPLLNPGDVIVFDSWLYHCAGTNVSEIDRYGVNHVFTAPFLKQQIDFPKLTDLRVFSDQLLQLMGSEFEVAKNVQDFREKRLKKQGK